MPAGGGGIKEEQEILLSPGAMGTMGGGGGGGGQGGGGGGGGAATGAGLTTSSVGDIDTPLVSVPVRVSSSIILLSRTLCRLAESCFCLLRAVSSSSTNRRASRAS
ncbi:GSCOCG00006861001-RA-CDS, partial [Cotesia congregata]